MYYSETRAVATSSVLGKGVAQIAPLRGLWNQLVDGCNPFFGKGLNQVGGILK